MQLIFAIALLWGGFLCGIIYSKGFRNEQKVLKEEKAKSKTSFRSPLVRYE